MTGKHIAYSNAPSSSPNPVSADTAQTRLSTTPTKKPSRKPDWLLIWVGILFLLTLLIAWLVDFPALLR